MLGALTESAQVFGKISCPLGLHLRAKPVSKLESGAIRCLRFDVRFGSIADIGEHVRNVRFTPESGHTAGCTKCPLSAKSRHRWHPSAPTVILNWHKHYIN
jgi:hypothetical protein